MEGMHKLLKHFQLCWIPLMTDSFWLECMETEVQNSKLLSLVRSPRKTAKIICSEKIDFDEFWSNKMGVRVESPSGTTREHWKQKAPLNSKVSRVLMRCVKSCLLPVLWKWSHGSRRSGPVYIPFVGSVVSFLKCFPNWPRKRKFVSRYFPVMMCQLLGELISWKLIGWVCIIWLLMRHGKVFSK